METTRDFLDVLALDDTADVRTIRRAYARQLKLIDQATQASAFQRLRDAYEAALAWADSQAVDEVAASPEDSSFVPIESAVLHEEVSSGAAMFARLQEAALRFAAAGRREDPDAWCKELYRCLDDELLVNIEARFEFEERIVHYLCGGWQPGNEALFTAAIEAFAWDAERRCLQPFGPAGALLNQAIEEQVAFDSQAVGVRGLQARLIMRLRWEDLPGESELRYNGTEFFTLVSAFPALMHITAGSANIQRWELAYQSLPAAVSGDAPQPPHWIVEVLPKLVLLIVLVGFVALNI